MTEEDYLKNRLENQLEWYSDQSRYNQKRFKQLRMIEIISASFIPFLSGMVHKIPVFSWIIGGLGVLIAVSTAINALYKFHENWIEYRVTVEQLKHEKFAYHTNTKPYDIDDKFSLLVERIEVLISKQNSAWTGMVKKTAIQNITKGST